MFGRGLVEVVSVMLTVKINYFFGGFNIMNGASISELCTDFNSDWRFNNGDLVLIEDKDNLVQATRNRLNCTVGVLDDFYYEYGSLLHTFLGWRKNETTLRFLRLELERALKQDPRYQNFELDLKYDKNGVLNIGVIVYFDEETTIEMNYTFSEDGTIIGD